MLIAVIDDEMLALKATVNAVREALSQEDIRQFSKHSELLSFAEENEIDIAFLDINLRGITGIELAEKLEKTNPEINIIFVTGFDDYKSKAMDIHASGYLMKPVTAEDIKKEMRFLRFPPKDDNFVLVKCFGNFSAQVKGSPIRFAYTKTEELFAYLIDRNGAPVNYGELSAILWEDDNHKEYLKKLRADLIKTFEDCGFPDVIICGNKTLAVNKNKIKCDYYDFLDKKEDGFFGEYMSQYSFAETTLGKLLMI